ncbi:hypothetical protein [Streptomyces sp. NPDC058613]|uniref:hypothetical protein n=1 Tax=Streptomyces sp. NPDC058613 TaxID=3346556 RepID=UPI0036566C92
MDETLDLLDVLLDSATEPRLKLISADEARAPGRQPPAVGGGSRRPSRRLDPSRPHSLQRRPERNDHSKDHDYYAL